MILRGDVLAQFDAEMRRDPIADPGWRVERVGPVVRVIGSESYVIFSELDDSNAREVIAEQIEFFRTSGGEVEWKVFGHDQPPNLEALLADAGFVPEEPETLVTFDLRDGIPGSAAPPDVEIRRVTNDVGLRDAAVANDAAFERKDGSFSARFSPRLSDPNLGLFVAYVDGAPAATGRVEITPGRSFAGLYGGGTSPPYRHRGIYRGLVAARAALAQRAGSRYLTVDARETSRPILENLGFVALTTTRPWILGRRPAGPE